MYRKIIELSVLVGRRAASLEAEKRECEMLLDRMNNFRGGQPQGIASTENREMLEFIDHHLPPSGRMDARK